ncbi:MAG TPA: hypothetical protein VJ925_06665, partial [Longimicrobiales bacterium]|nr:hypothetical protein [Longimicrobiales bacterium]
MYRSLTTAALVGLLTASTGAPLAAQDNSAESRPDTISFVLDRIAVTATRDAQAVRTIPRPVSVV